MKALRYLLTSILMMAVAACAGSSLPKNEIPQRTGAFDSSREAMVLFKTVGVDGDGDRSLIKVYVQKEGTSLIQYYIIADKETDEPILERLEPGRYVFIIIAGDILVKPREPLPPVTYDPARGIPLTPIDVKAGDVLYLGNIMVQGLHGGAVTGRAKGVEYRVEDHSELGRQSLQKYHPDLATRMETRLVGVVQ